MSQPERISYSRDGKEYYNQEFWSRERPQGSGCLLWVFWIVFSLACISLLVGGYSMFEGLR